MRTFRQYWAVSKNAFVVSLGDPIYLVMLLTVLILMAFLASLPTFAFGHELKLIRDQSLALLFIAGCLVSCIGAATVVVRDLRLGAISVLMSRPVSSFSVVAGKWTGLAGALLVFSITTSVSVLWITKMVGQGLAEDSRLDVLSLSVYAGAIILALLSMAVKHYLFGGWYVWQANVAIFFFFIAAFAVATFLPGPGGLDTTVDWVTGQGCLMLLLAQLIFAALLFPFAVRVDAVTLLVIGVLIFFFGLVAEYLVASALGRGSIAYSLIMPLLPNWQPFWIGDMLASDKHLSMKRLLASMVQAIAYVLGCLAVSTLIFNKREFSGTDVI